MAAGYLSRRSLTSTNVASISYYFIVLLRLQIVSGNLPQNPDDQPSLHRHQNASSHSTEQRLIQHLLRGYDTDARGVSSAVNETLRVEIQLLLMRIQGLDERSQVLTTTGLIICDWNDNRLRWRTEDFDDLTDIVVRPDRIWLPELALMNGAQELAPDFKKVRVMLRHDGHVHWEPGGVFTTTCDIDIRYFPFDDQSCPIQFGAWAYYSSRMNITNAGPDVQIEGFRLNGEWILHRTSAVWKENVLPCCPDTRYPYVEFTLYLRRRHYFYVMNIIIPCTLLSVLVMIVFCLPPDAGEKISLGISVLLAFSVFLLMVAESIPRTSLHIPIIVIYLTSTMGLGTLSVCLTVLVLNLHYRDPERQMPNWLRTVLLVYVARWIGGVRTQRTRASTKRTSVAWPTAAERRIGGVQTQFSHLLKRRQRLDRNRDVGDGVSSSRKFKLERSSSSGADRCRQGLWGGSEPNSRTALVVDSPQLETASSGSERRDASSIAAESCSGSCRDEARNNATTAVDHHTVSIDDNLSQSRYLFADRIDDCSKNFTRKGSPPAPTNGSGRYSRGRTKNGGTPGRSLRSIAGSGCSGSSGAGVDAAPTEHQAKIHDDNRAIVCRCPHHYDADDIREDSEIENINLKAYTEWKDAAKVLDRVFFWVVFLAMSFSALVIMMVPLYRAENELPPD